MNCCGGTEISKYYNRDDLIKQLRSINDPKNDYDKESNNKDDLKIEMKLRNFNCRFDPETGEWKNDFNKVVPIRSIEFDEEILKLKQELNELEIKYDDLEKEYLAKAVRLLYMAQTHLNLKTENDILFEKFGIKTGNPHLDLNKLFPNANNSTIKTQNKNNEGQNSLVIEEFA